MVARARAMRDMFPFADALVAKAVDALNNPIVFLQEMLGVEYIVDSELVCPFFFCECAGVYRSRRIHNR
jgi:hypothetical protein